MLTIFLYDALTRNYQTIAFLITALVLIVLGALCLKLKVKPLGLIDALITASISWFTISLISAIPLAHSLKISLLDALFETVSGFTGTGFTVINDVTGLPATVKLWRSFMQWCGELGIVVFAMILFPFFYNIGSRVYGVERPLKIEASFRKTAYRLFILYTLLTSIGFVTFLFTGMHPFDALNHILTTVSTGGMSTYTEGYGVVYRNNPLSALPVILFMILGSINFILLDKAFRGNIKAVLKNDEFFTYAVLLTVLSISTGTLYATIEGMGIEGYSIGVFNLISGATTTGFNLGLLRELKPITKFTIMVGMFIGGMTFATVGGIKVYRFMVILKKMKIVSLSLITIGRYEKAVKVNGSILSEEEVSFTVLFTLIHLVAVSIGAVIISSFGYDYIDALFEATSAASCVGLSTGIAGNAAPVAVKLVIITLMLMGKLEYIQLFLVVGFLGGRRILKTLK